MPPFRLRSRSRAAEASNRDGTSKDPPKRWHTGMAPTAHMKLNHPDIDVGDRVRYMGTYGHVSAILPKVLDDAPYCVAFRTDEGFLIKVQIDPTEPISSDSDCHQMKFHHFTKEELKRKGGKKKKQKVSDGGVA